MKFSAIAVCTLLVAATAFSADPSKKVSTRCFSADLRAVWRRTFGYSIVLAAVPSGPNETSLPIAEIFMAAFL